MFNFVWIFILAPIAVRGHDATVMDCTSENNSIILNSCCEHHELYAPGTSAFVGTLIGCIIIVCCAGVFSGLTLGLLSLDKNSISVLLAAGEGKQKQYAKTLLPIVNQHHRLLVTLLVYLFCFYIVIVLWFGAYICINLLYCIPSNTRLSYPVIKRYCNGSVAYFSREISK